MPLKDGRILADRVSPAELPGDEGLPRREQLLQPSHAASNSMCGGPGSDSSECRPQGGSAVPGLLVPAVLDGDDCRGLLQHQPSLLEVEAVQVLLQFEVSEPELLDAVLLVHQPELVLEPV